MNKQDAIIATRQHFANLQHAIIADVKSGECKVNNPEKYIAKCEQHASDFLAGVYDNTFTSMQYAHYLMTGHCVALLAQVT